MRIAVVVAMAIGCGCVNPNEQRDVDHLERQMGNGSRCEFTGNINRPYIYLCRSGDVTKACTITSSRSLVLCSDWLPVTATGR